MRKSLLILSALSFIAFQETTAQSCMSETSQSEFAAGVSTIVDLATSPGDVQLQTISSDQQNTNVSTVGTGVTITSYGGQTFTPSASGQLAKVSMHLFCSGCTGTTPSLNVQIRSTASNLPTSTVLASTTIPGFSSGTDAIYTAVFASPAGLTAGTKYAIVLYPSANPSPGIYALTRSGSDVYAGGTRVAGATGGTVWSIPLTGGISTDAGFTTYMTSSTGIAGTFTSQVKDAGAVVNGGTLSFTATTPANTDLKFQVAASNNVAGPFSFVGPDNTASTYFTTSGVSLANFTNQQYFRYKAFLANSDGTSTPTLSDVTLCFTASTLPVRWLQFSGSLNASSQALIDWQVQETAVADYEIQKSADGIRFSPVATIAGKGDGIHAYHFTEQSQLTATSYFRIRQKDKNGQSTYSSVVKLENRAAGRFTIGPNPAWNTITVTVSSEYLNKKAELINASGLIVSVFQLTQTTTTIDVSELSRGVYILRLEGGQSQKINKQ